MAARRKEPVWASASRSGLVPNELYEHFSDWADMIHGPGADGASFCACHPNCGIGMALMIDKETKEAVPVTAF